jgi:hypothetical protein
MKKALTYFLTILLLSLFLSCTRTESPSLETLSILDITTNSATGGGYIKSDGGEDVVSRGIVWSDKQNPSLQSHIGLTMDETGIGVFTSSLTNLLPGTAYYVKAYATNLNGTSYGQEVKFETNEVAQVILTTASISGITNISATSGGFIVDDGGGTVTEKGVCWSTSTNPTTSNFRTTDGFGNDSFTSILLNLQPGITYYVRAYATNSAGLVYGNELIFRTATSAP